MSPRREEMTLGQLLNDPMILAGMKADRSIPPLSLNAFGRRRAGTSLSMPRRRLRYRELSDIGLNRYDIGRIARETAAA
jgi:hypothetical protein